MFNRERSESERFADHDEAFHSGRVSDPLDRFAGFGQTQLVASAARDGGLPAESGVSELENRVDVVVESADETRFDDVVDAHCGERVADFFEVEFGFIAEERRRIGGVFDDGAATFLFAVEDTPDVALETLPAVVAHVFEVRCEVFAQRLFRRGAVGSDAPGVEVKREPGDSDFIQVVNEHGDTLGVEFGRDFSSVFHADLVKLAAASGGGTLSAEHGADVEDAVLHAVECVGS